eukprot:12406457-Karenia_brevis.AAC.1
MLSVRSPVRHCTHAKARFPQTKVSCKHYDSSDPLTAWKSSTLRSVDFLVGWLGVLGRRILVRLPVPRVWRPQRKQD